MGEELKVADILKVLTGPDRIRIIKDKTVLHTGYLSMLPEEYKGETVKRFCTFPEIRHKEWKPAISVALDNYPDIIEMGDAFQVRNDDWKLF